MTQANLVCVPGMIWDMRVGLFELLRSMEAPSSRASMRPRQVSRDELLPGRADGDGAQIQLQGMASFESGEPMVSWVARIRAREDADTGFAVQPVPTRRPDIVDRTKTREDQTLLYWLNDERELVHVDPVDAAKSGFPAQMLHGAYTASTACRAILRHVCDYNSARIAEFDFKWSVPAVPGETIETAMWIDDDRVSFRCISVDRGEVVIDHGRCKLHRWIADTEGSA